MIAPRISDPQANPAEGGEEREKRASSLCEPPNALLSGESNSSQNRSNACRGTANASERRPACKPATSSSQGQLLGRQQPMGPTRDGQRRRGHQPHVLPMLHVHSRPRCLQHRVRVAFAFAARARSADQHRYGSRTCGANVPSEADGAKRIAGASPTAIYAATADLSTELPEPFPVPGRAVDAHVCAAPCAICGSPTRTLQREGTAAGQERAQKQMALTQKHDYAHHGCEAWRVNVFLRHARRLRPHAR